MKTRLRAGQILVTALALAATLQSQDVWARHNHPPSPASVTAVSPGILRLQNRVTDKTGTLSEGEIEHIAHPLAALEKQTGRQVVILLVPTARPQGIDQYAGLIFAANSLGQGGHDGLLLVVAKQEHRIRIVTSVGLKMVLTDTDTDSLIHEVIAPHFKEGDFAGGLQAFVRSIVPKLGGKLDRMAPDLSFDDTAHGTAPAAEMPASGRHEPEPATATHPSSATPSAAGKVDARPAQPVENPPPMPMPRATAGSVEAAGATPLPLPPLPPLPTGANPQASPGVMVPQTGAPLKLPPPAGLPDRNLPGMAGHHDRPRFGTLGDRIAVFALFIMGIVVFLIVRRKVSRQRNTQQMEELDDDL